MNKIFILLILPLFVLSANKDKATASARQIHNTLKIRKIISPNKKYFALITTYHFKSNGSSESKIEIFSSSNKPVAFENFISKDHNHGMEIIKTAWTHDSKFFVFNGVLQGGHQPGHLPTYFFSIKSSKIQPLDPLVGIWITGNFNILSNDRLSVQIKEGLPNGSINDSLVKKIDLKDLKRK